VDWQAVGNQLPLGRASGPGPRPSPQARADGATQFCEMNAVAVSLGGCHEPEDCGHLGADCVEDNWFLGPLHNYCCSS
jgi:hypothetical protein